MSPLKGENFHWLMAKGEVRENRIIKRILCAMAGLKVDVPCEEECRWPLELENSPWLLSSKKIVSPILCLQETGICQQPEWTWKQILLQSFQDKCLVWETQWCQPCEIFSGVQISPPRFWPTELQDNKWVLFQITTFLIIDNAAIENKYS